MLIIPQHSEATFVCSIYNKVSLSFSVTPRLCVREITGKRVRAATEGRPYTVSLAHEWVSPFPPLGGAKEGLSGSPFYLLCERAALFCGGT